MKKLNVLSFAAALSCALIAPVVRAQAPAAPTAQAQTPDADIQALINQVEGAYRNLTTFSTTLETVQTNGTNEIKTTTKLTLKKPALLSAEVKSGDNVVHVVADGKMVYSDSSKDNTKYVKLSADNLDDVISFLARNRGAGIGLLPILLTSANAEKQIIPGKPASVKRQPDQKIGSDDCDVI